MTFQLTRTLLLTLTALSLTACGGGGGGAPGTGGGTPPSTVEPIASVGFANATTDFATGGTTFETKSNNIMFVDQQDQRRVKNDTIRLTFSDDLQSLTIVRGGRQGAALTPNGPNAYIDNSTFTQLTTISTATNGDARLAEIGGRNNVRGHSNFIVYGFDTDPATVAAETGSVNYSGNVRAAYAPNLALVDGYANGTFELTANFGSGRVNGNMSIDQLDVGVGNNMAVLQGSTNWEMNDAQINGNGFSGTLSQGTDGVDADTTVNAANYDGRFYGVDGDAVGGHFLIELTEGGEDGFIYGAFLGNEN